MDRDKIKNLLEKLDDISKLCNYDEFILVIYVYVRYGLYTFNNYMDITELEKIKTMLNEHNTLFDEDINYQADVILNDED